MTDVLIVLCCCVVCAYDFKIVPLCFKENGKQKIGKMKGSQGRVEMEQNRKERERKRSKKYTPCSFHISMLVFLLFIIFNTQQIKTKLNELHGGR